MANKDKKNKNGHGRKNSCIQRFFFIRICPQQITLSERQFVILLIAFAVCFALVFCFCTKILFIVAFVFFYLLVRCAHLVYSFLCIIAFIPTTLWSCNGSILFCSDRIDRATLLCVKTQKSKSDILSDFFHFTISGPTCQSS